MACGLNGVSGGTPSVFLANTSFFGSLADMFLDTGGGLCTYPDLAQANNAFFGVTPPDVQFQFAHRTNRTNDVPVGAVVDQIAVGFQVRNMGVSPVICDIFTSDGTKYYLQTTESVPADGQWHVIGAGVGIGIGLLPTNIPLGGPWTPANISAQLFGFDMDGPLDITAAWIDVYWTMPGTGPTVTDIDPAQSGPGGGNTITLTGTGFTTATDVTVDGVSVPFTIVSDTEITFGAPAHAVGTVSVEVTNPDGSAAIDFDYVDLNYDFPTITSVVPDEGPVLGGTAVTITGTNFVPGMLIYFDGILATDIAYVNSTTYTCVSPQHELGTIDVSMVQPFQ